MTVLLRREYSGERERSRERSLRCLAEESPFELRPDDLRVPAVGSHRVNVETELYRPHAAGRTKVPKRGLLRGHAAPPHLVLALPHVEHARIVNVKMAGGVNAARYQGQV